MVEPSGAISLPSDPAEKAKAPAPSGAFPSSQVVLLTHNFALLLATGAV